MDWISLAVGTLVGGAGLYGLCESGARFWIRRTAFRVFRPRQRIVYLPIEELKAFLTDPIRLSFNSEGERGPEPPQGSGNVYRVLVCGGSTAECALVSDGETWHAVLHRELQKRRGDGVTVHVGSIARSGLDSAAILRILQCVLPQYGRVDLLVVMGGHSDVLRWLDNGMPDRDLEELPSGDLFQNDPTQSFSWNPRHGAVAEACRRLWWSISRAVREIPSVGKRQVKTARTRAQAPDIPTDELPSVERPLELLAERMEAIVDLGQQYADRVMVVPQIWCQSAVNPMTSQTGLLWQGLITKGRFSGSRVSDNDLAELMRRCAGVVAETSRRKGAEVVDLEEAGFEATMGNLYDEAHLTRHGCEVVGQILADRVLYAESGTAVQKSRDGC